MFAIASFITRRIAEPAFLFLVLLGVLLAMASNSSGETDMSPLSLFAASQELRNLRFGPFLLLCLSMAGAVFIGATEIPRDIDSRLISILMSKPIHRWQYLAGKFLGVFFLCYGIYAFWILTLFASNRVTATPELHLPWEVLLDSLLAGLVLGPICAAAVTLSCYFEELASMVLTFAFILVAGVMGILPILQTFLPKPLFLPFLLLYYCFPNVDYFLSVPAPPLLKAVLVVYAVAASLVFLAAALPRFYARDLH